MICENKPNETHQHQGLILNVKLIKIFIIFTNFLHLEHLFDRRKIITNYRLRPLDGTFQLQLFLTYQ